MHQGRRRAYCRFDGFFVSANPLQPTTFFGSQIEGHAHFDLEDGYIAEAQVKITELEDCRAARWFSTTI